MKTQQSECSYVSLVGTFIVHGDMLAVIDMFIMCFGIIMVDYIDDVFTVYNNYALYKLLLGIIVSSLPHRVAVWLSTEREFQD